jgi:hypothetical protein
MSDDDRPSAAALKEAKRLMAEADRHERGVAIREESAQYLDERGDHEGAARERREAELERDAARLAWDRATALQGPTQTTDAGLEIPIPTREDFVRNLEKVAPKPQPVETVARPTASGQKKTRPTKGPGE